MKKSFIAILLAAALTVCMTACSSSDKEDVKTTTSPYEAAETCTVIVEGKTENLEYKTFSSQLGYQMNYFFNYYSDNEFSGNQTDSDIFWASKSDGSLPNVFLSININNEHSAKELADGIVLQSGKDDCKAEKVKFGSKNYDAYKVYFEEGDGGLSTTHTFYLVQAKDKVFQIEIGSYAEANEGHSERFAAMLDTFTIL